MVVTQHFRIAGEEIREIVEEGDINSGDLLTTLTMYYRLEQV